ncbi:MAG: SH3 domain-containing protein [bacterium]
MKFNWLVLVLANVIPAMAFEPTNFQVRVVGDDVNVRVRPDAGTEVVTQLQAGQFLSAVRVEGDWVGILAPTNAGLWVKKQYVKDGVVTGDKIRIRSGPGISYRDVGMLSKGAVLTELGSHGDWLKVAAPADLVLWVNRTMVQSFEGGSLSAPVAIAQETVPAVEKVDVATNAPLSRELPAGLSRDDLAPVLGQGTLVERSGTVERVPLAFFRGMDYRLVTMRDQRKATVCYLRGNETQMPSLVDRRLTVKGREYWLNNQRYAVIYPELITPLP